MMNLKKMLVTTWFCMILASNSLASDKVLATYNGQNIHKSEVEMKLRSFFNGSLPDGKKNFDDLDKQMRQKIVSDIVHQKLLEEAMTSSNIPKGEVFKQQISEIYKQVSVNLFLDHYAKRLVSEQKIQVEYSNVIKSLKGNKELRISHILIKNENDARDVLNNIKESKISFEDAAKKHSIDSSNQKGGDLGYISKGTTVPEFEKAAYSAKKGDVVGPIKTQFGWHLIKMSDSRKVKVPKYEEIKPELEQSLLMKVKKEFLSNVIKGAKVETFVN